MAPQKAPICLSSILGFHTGIASTLTTASKNAYIYSNVSNYYFDRLSIMVRQILIYILLTISFDSISQHSVELKGGIGLTPFIQSHENIEWYQYDSRSREPSKYK